MQVIFVQVLAIMLATVVLASGSIQLQPSQGILIPAPMAQSLRLGRGAYTDSSKTTYGLPTPERITTPYTNAGETIQTAPSNPASSYASYSAPGSIAAPACPQSYMFSCGPSLQPVPCSAPAPAYPSYAPSAGSQGSYSHYVPQYATPEIY